MDARPVDVVSVGTGGLEHDRAFAVRAADGRVLGARDVPGLADVRADPPVAGRPPALLLPGADAAVRGADADAALGTLAGAGAALAPVDRDDAPQAPVHLVSRDGGQPLPRANLVLDLREPRAEEGWVGREPGGRRRGAAAGSSSARLRRGLRRRRAAGRRAGRRRGAAARPGVIRVRPRR
ncbi:hypothetical protein GCM10025868_04650 [Angustibacter aerolatus]|uniref:Uncharacterized protein n=1 Tax=Angustibacter aerolatus TaxID=1162965 RepID=A0ABQ6JAL8_9ACTN|nr:hypothetical protein GCM10025868_04650 [Angustibacter aerolatus]